jgi:hypothetical protein
LRALAVIVACLGLGGAMLGCGMLQTEAHRPPRTDAVLDAPILLPVGALAEDVVMQQRVTVRWKDREESFGAVLQKRGQELLLLGLGPMNTVGFRLSLVEGHVSFENRTGRDVPFVPERILADVQRVFYPWIEGESRCTRCDRRGVRGDLEIVEHIGDEHLEQRRFFVRDRPERGEIVVRYDDWPRDAIAPHRAVLSNGWFGYELLIETTSAERLD